MGASEQKTMNEIDFIHCSAHIFAAPHKSAGKIKGLEKAGGTKKFLPAARFTA
ncbi:hypothetical protein ACSHT0_12520 [Tepidicaulis sp. LMO-SS28]|uniref:hypothetical protein n=1 Tax=Tepidicaulis sp. LMO-SS28 TaxID=3447455 RepID=UPI003EE10478